MHIRLLTYATGIYEPRRQLLAASARASRAVNEVATHSPANLSALGFQRRCPEISLTERGGGWWTWKPFLIHHELERMREGDWLLYCDVGRTYPMKMLDRPLVRLIDWAEEKNQPCLPGVMIPWNGPMSRWTKRDAFVIIGMDKPESHEATPIQASFSLWKAGPEALALAGQWLDWCSDRRLVTDDPNTCGKENLPDHREHRHDQSLLTLLCLREGIQGLPLGDTQPGFDEKNPALVARSLGESGIHSGAGIATLKFLSPILGGIESIPRRLLRK